MANTTKAVIFSALILPGSGQLIQKNYYRGGLIIILLSIALYVFIGQLMDETNAIVHNINSGALNISDARQAVLNRLDNPAFNTAKYGIVLLWLCSIIDVILTGRKSSDDQKNESTLGEKGE